MANDLISLFDQGPPIKRGVSAFAMSVTAHAIAAAVLSYGIVHNLRIQNPAITERYALRHLALQMPKPRPVNAASAVPYPGPVRLAALEARARSESAEAVREVPHAAEGRQTLIQPDLKTRLTASTETLVPTVMIWKPADSPVKQIAAPPPEPLAAAEVKPVLARPNQDEKLAELSVAPVTMPENAKLPLLPTSNTSPVVVHGPQDVQRPPATVASAAQPAPAAVLSISDTRMVEGTVTLPPVNQVHAPTATSGLSLGLGKAGPPAAKESAGNQTLGTGPDSDPSSTSQKVDAQAADAEKGPAQVAAARPDGGDDDAFHADASKGESAEHIEAPHNGRFGVVVVGTSLAEEYPETLQVWSDRVAYTAYLHVGLAKNWIMQYSQVRAADGSAGGSVSQIDAPWPYDIWRPNLIARETNSDAVMVHGIVNTAGRFESLAIAFPAQFPHASFVLYALKHWQFRPARQNGKATAVEVLLIIPDEVDD